MVLICTCHASKKPGVSPTPSFYLLSLPLSLVVLHSVSHFDQVIRQLLDRVRGRTGLHALGVVCNEHGLRGLDDDDAFSALDAWMWC